MGKVEVVTLMFDSVVFIVNDSLIGVEDSNKMLFEKLRLLHTSNI